jgi:AraC-like DNA-binding protein
MSDRLIIIISGTAILNLTLIAILSWLKSKSRPANFWLGWMFFASAAAILDNTYIFEGKGTIILYHIGIFFNLAFGGYLIAFTNSLRNPELTKLKIDWRLFIPAYLYFPFFILTFIQPHWASDTIHMAEVGKMTPFGMFYNFCICTYSIIANAVLLWQSYLSKDIYNISKLQQRRIKELLWVMFSLQTLAFLPFMLQLNVNYIVLYMPIFGQIFFLYVFFRISYSSHLLFENDLYPETTTKYATINLNDDRTDEIRLKIVELMNVEKPYLKMDYTLTEMAKDLKILPNQLSMVINSKLNCSFPEYVNSLRIKTSIELLNKANSSNLTIEAIAYESGFNNRTSFYKAFKKQTGKLPSEYLKKTTAKKELA